MDYSLKKAIKISLCYTTEDMHENFLGTADSLPVAEMWMSQVSHNATGLVSSFTPTALIMMKPLTYHIQLLGGSAGWVVQK